MSTRAYPGKTPGKWAGWLNTLTRGIKAFLDRHQITDADGKPLRLNVMRLRKTFENHLFTLSGQDPFPDSKARWPYPEGVRQPLSGSSGKG
ncbi:hypothetical protein HAALTHF_52300n [Vreelandella aquamarina]|nr:hypothetical protein HAALTHF_52300n [Halomonas axialensis]